ncbi:uncharacterized protein [Nicotiana sylvestris]|uniref:Uncharacterized protein LOC104238219 isoform X2 n=1 Tax=Nicotiana sylvestris TaxID=4096 RepID=A0A1U7XFH2_NICSY|nr:PREDICTED: uncharacterized protein LOC104238219 isoform X2 [Nicotiana sylvestris]
MESSSRSRNKLSNSLRCLFPLSSYVASRDHHEAETTKTRAKHEVAAMCTDSVAKFGIVELGVVVCAEVSGTAICDEVSQAAAIGVSKRGRSVKKKIMTDYVSAVIKKKSRVRK